jgi:hypothetical protein
MNRRSIAGSGIGGIPETQEMLDFCAQHKLTADVEVVPVQKVNEAVRRELPTPELPELMDQHAHTGQSQAECEEDQSADPLA